MVDVTYTFLDVKLRMFLNFAVFNVDKHMLLTRALANDGSVTRHSGAEHPALCHQNVALSCLLCMFAMSFTCVSLSDCSCTCPYVVNVNRRMLLTCASLFLHLMQARVEENHRWIPPTHPEDDLPGGPRSAEIISFEELMRCTS